MDSRLKALSISELLAEGEIPIEWLWEPFIPKGSVSTLTAYMKVGKSTLVYAFIAALVRGEPFCGFPTTKTPVLILAVEEHKREVVNRLLRFGAKTTDPIMVHTGPLAPSAETYAGLDKVIKDNHIGLVVVDTLSRFWAIADENDNAMALRALAPLQDMARETGAAVLLIHHNGKMEAGGGRDIRGASALFGAVDQALILKHHGEHRSTFRRLETFGRYDDTPPEIIVQLDEDTDSYKLLGTQRDARLETIRHQVKEWLLANPGAHRVESLMAVLKLPKSSIFKALAAPQDWLLRAGTGRKGSPFSYQGILPGGVLEEQNQNVVQFPGRKLLQLSDQDLYDALDLSHLAD